MLGHPFSMLVSFALLAPVCAPASAEDCNGRLVYVDDPAGVGDNYPLFMKTRRNIYVMRGSCFQLSGSEFRGSITFFTFSRAPEGFTGTYGELAIKSIRTFRIPTQGKKIMLSRNDGWYLPDQRQDAMKPVPAVPDIPIAISVTDWNALYTDPKRPELFEGIELKWHAYPGEDKLISSMTWPDFWKLDSGDFDRRVVTNYLIRFTVNPATESRNRVPFYVNTPRDVERVDLSVQSNVGSLATNYTFVLK